MQPCGVQGTGQGRVDGGDDRFRVDMFRQRQLHQNAMNLGVAVQVADYRQQFALRRFGGQAMRPGFHAYLFGGASLVADIDLARRILANQNGGESRSLAAGRNFRLHFLAHAFGDGGAVDDARAHPITRCRMKDCRK
jgi:hypothetical protein